MPGKSLPQYTSLPILDANSPGRQDEQAASQDSAAPALGGISLPMGTPGFFQKNEHTES